MYIGYPEINQSNANSVTESGHQIFQTGSGNPVAVNQSSLSKASAMLGDIISDQGLQFPVPILKCFTLLLHTCVYVICDCLIFFFFK